MNRNLLMIVMVGAIIALSACNQSENSNESATLTPSEALEQFNNKYFEKTATVTDRDERIELRKSIASDYLKKVNSEGLSPEEELDFANLLYTAGQEEQAMEIENRIAAGDDIPARNANLMLMDHMIRKENYTALTEAVDAYRARFQPIPEHTNDLFGPLIGLLSHYIQTDASEKVIELIETELNRLPNDAPYASFRLIDYGTEYFASMGKADQVLEIAKEKIGLFEKIIEERNANAPENGDDDQAYAQTTNNYKRLAKSFGNAITRLELIGSPAPGFNFIQFFNTDPISLEDLKGKVVMIDFWANWCGPCKAAFPSMRKLYDDFKDEGFVILGVTSFQGSFTDGEIRERGIDQERELELTKDFIDRYEMTWPIAFSDRNVYDENYGIYGIPTFAILDKKGNIRLIKIGSGEDSERDLREIVPKLLAE